MSVKNAIKIMVNRFGLVFSIFVFISVVGILLVSMSVAFLPSILSHLKEGGLYEVFDKLSIDTLSIKTIYEAVGEIADIVKSVFMSSTKFKVNTSLYVGVVLIFCYRLFVGYYELPAIDVLEAKMSSNARIGFVNRFISNFAKSTKFIFAKMLYTIAVDMVIFIAMYGVFNLWGINRLLNIFVPFIAISIYILLQSLRFSVIALWSPAVAENKGKIFSSFKYSCRSMAKNFPYIYGCFLIAWILIFVINVLVGIITFGAGLLLTIPMSITFICCLNLTIYFKIKNRKYYLDDEHLSS